MGRERLETLAGQLLALIAYNLPLLALQMSRPQTAIDKRFNWPRERERVIERVQLLVNVRACTMYVGQPQVTAAQHRCPLTHTLSHQLTWPSLAKPI